MGELLIKPYEISVWEDVLVTQGEGEQANSYYKERKIAVIGSNTMTGLNSIYEPVFTKKSNGEKTLKFSLKYKYFDPYSENDGVINPFAALLVNERKVKLYYDNTWYDFIVKEHSESSDGLIWTYTCTDAFVLELSKNGYNIEFNVDLNNNQGTAAELAKETLKDTDWTVVDEGIEPQRIKEAIYYGKLQNHNAVNIIDAETQRIVDDLSDNLNIYIFYSYIANKNGEFVQFILQSDKTKTDDKNTILADNYRINDKLVYKEDTYSFVKIENNNETVIIQLDLQDKQEPNDPDELKLETQYHAYRLVYGQLTTYDPVLKRTVKRYVTGSEENPGSEIFSYTDYKYTTSDVLINYVTNGDNFNVYESGSLQGWNDNTPYTFKQEGSGQDSYYVVPKIELVTYPKVEMDKLLPLESLTGIDGYICSKFNSTLTNDYKNTFFNSGITDHASFIESIARDEEFVFRFRGAKSNQYYGNLTNLDGSEIRAIVAAYDKVDFEDAEHENHQVNKINPNGIILDFTGEATVCNNEIYGGVLETTQDNKLEYVIDGVVQTPSTNYIYYVEENNIEVPYIWDRDNQTYINDISSYSPYYYLTAKAKKPVSNEILSDVTVNIGIFIYTTNANNWYYLQDVQLTRCYYYEDKNNNKQLVTLGNIPVATSISTTYYYVEPKVGTAAEKVRTYTTLDALQKEEPNITNIRPKYNDKSEKILSISESQSNCFNILQTIAETFECWIDLVVEHDSNGAIYIDEEGNYNKQVHLKKYAGKDNYTGFKYGINLDSIERTINSDEIVTKLIVDSTQSEYTDEGSVSIQYANSNPSKESYILNFDYYLNQNLIANKEDCRKDISLFEQKVASYNKDIFDKQKEKRDRENSLTKIGSQRNIYTEMVNKAIDNREDNLKRFKELTGYSYQKHQYAVENYPDGYVPSEDEIAIKDKIYYRKNGQEYEEVKNISTSSFDKIINFNFPPIDLKEYNYDSTTIFRSINLDTTGLETFVLFDGLERLTFTISKLRPIYCSGGLTNIRTYNIPIQSNEIEIFPYPCEFNVNADAFYDNIKTNVVLEGHSVITFNCSFRYLANTHSLTYTVIISPQLNTGLTDITCSGKFFDYINYKTNSPKIDGLYEHIDLLENNEDITNLIGEIYSNSAIINNYSGLLTNINNEYYQVRHELYGNEEFNFSAVRVQDDLSTYHLQLSVNDYVSGLIFKTPGAESTYPVTVSTKTFDIKNASQFMITNLPDGYTVYDANDNIISINQIISVPIESNPLTFTLVPNTKVPSIQDLIDEKIEQKRQYIKKFYNKYSRFIQEGTWNSNEYIDSELYYLDALQVSKTSAQPNISYTINVVEISELEGFEAYLFDAGDKTYIEDTEFFGWGNIHGNLTPAREEVIVSEIEWHLDDPSQNTITVQNYKTQFEDLFQRISATVQTVQYNEATYAKISSLLDSNGTINQDVMIKSLNNVSGQKYTLTTDGSVLIEGDAIQIRNLNSPGKYVKISSSGISFSSDGIQWKEAITGDGINIGAITSDFLNTREVIIGDSENPSFRWDSKGINAYKETENGYDLNTFVRYDQYGLYGIKNDGGFGANSLAEVADNAYFAVTWDGFFIKNSYEDGGRVSITSDNDFQVIDGSEVERIKIGSLGIDSQTQERIYGINISDKNGNSVLSTNNDGDLTITGTIYANAGEIGGMIVNDDKLTMDHIVLEPGVGIYSDWGETSTNPFIISDTDGSAIFNNITVRGSIKTSVFEYEEIQAVGGAFMFRPSTSIKTVSTADNVIYDENTGHYSGDLIITVDKPLIVRDGAWYKLSNYHSDSTVTADELSTYGLVHIYQLSKTTIDDITELRLIDAASILEIVELNEIAGGSIIDMGYEVGHIDYNNGKKNYGIGINSSDNYINLPPRAISLFETVVDHLQNPKVSYRYRGILGTLPDERVNNIVVNNNIYPYMRGTQGIYTDNMYIGDNDQYLAFYEDGQGQKQLKIKANQIMFEISDPAPGEESWKDITDVAEGAKGDDAINVEIDSSGGNVFINGIVSTILRCFVYKGGIDITHDNNYIKTYTWKKINIIDGSEIPGWTPTPVPLEPNAIRIGVNDVNSKAVFQCTVNIEEA